MPGEYHLLATIAALASRRAGSRPSTAREIHQLLAHAAGRHWSTPARMKNGSARQRIGVEAVAKVFLVQERSTMPGSACDADEAHESDATAGSVRPGIISSSRREHDQSSWLRT